MRQISQNELKSNQAVPVEGFSSVTAILRNIAKDSKNINRKLSKNFGSIKQLNTSNIDLCATNLNTISKIQNDTYEELKQVRLSINALQTMMVQYMEFIGVGKKVGKKASNMALTETIRKKSPIDNKQSIPTLNVKPIINKLQEMLDFFKQRFNKEDFGTGKKQTNLQTAETIQESQPVDNQQLIQSIDIQPVTNKLQEILNFLQDSFDKEDFGTGKKLKSKPTDSRYNKEFVNMMNSVLNSRDVMSEFMRLEFVMQQQINILYSIDRTLRDIYAFLPQMNISGAYEPVKQQAGLASDEFNRLVNSLAQLDKSLSKDFISNFKILVETYLDFIDEKNTKKLMLVSVQLIRFSFVLNKFAFSLRAARKVFRSLTLSIVILAVALITPPFTIGMALLFLMAKKLQATFNPKFAFGFTRSMASIRNVIIGLVLAMIMMNYVKPQSMFLILGFIAMLTIVMQRFNKTNKGVNKPVNVTKISANNYGIGDGLFGLSIGLAVLVLVIASVDKINWTTAGLVVGFIAILGTVMFLFGKRRVGRGDAFKGIMQLSIGLALLLLTVEAIGEVNWAGAGLLGAFIIALGVALFIQNKFAGKSSFGGKFGLLGFAFGLTILILCVDAVTELNWKGAFILLGFIIAIGFALALPGLISKGSRRQPMGGMFGFAAGLALIILCIDAADELKFWGAFKVLMLITGLVGITHLMKGGLGAKALVNNTKALLMLFGGFAAIVYLIQLGITPAATVPCAIVFGTIVAMTFISMFVSKHGKQITASAKLTPMFGEMMILWLAVFFSLNYIDVSLEKTITFVTGIAAIVGITYLTGKFSKEIKKGTKVIVDMVPGILTFIGMYFIISLLPPNPIGLTAFVISIAALVSVSIFAGMFDKLAKKGANVLMSISIAMTIASVGFIIINSMDLRVENFITFGITVGILSAVACILGIPAVSAVALTGAGILIVLMGSLLVGAMALWLISTIQINNENISGFGLAIGEIAKALGKNIGWLLLAVPAAVLLIPVAAASLLVAGLFALINLIPSKPEKIQQFAQSIGILINKGFEKIGLIAVGKAALKAVAMVPIATSALLVAGLFKLISLMNIDPKKMQVFTDMISLFVDTFGIALETNRKKLDGQLDNIKAVAQMASAAGSIINIIESFANMKIGKWRYNESKQEMEIYDYEELTDKHFNAVDANLGKMISALIKPLSTISSDSDIWDFNGVKVKNPFSGQGFFGTGKNAGTNRLKMIGDAFEKIPAIVQGLVNNQVLMNVENGQNQIENVTKNLGSFFTGLTNIILDFNKSGINKKHVENMYDTFADQNRMHNLVIRTTNIGQELSKTIFWKFGNTDIVWNRIEKFVASLVKNVKTIQAGNINSSMINSYSDIFVQYKGMSLNMVEAGKSLMDSIFVTNGDAIIKSSNSIISFSDATAKSLTSLGNPAIKGYDVNIGKKVIDFYKSLETLTNNKWITYDKDIHMIVEDTTLLVNLLSDGNKFTRITTNLKNTSKSVKEIVDNINKINIPKAEALERNLKLLSQAQSIEAIKQAVNELQKLIGTLVEAQKQQVVITEKIEKKTPDGNKTPVPTTAAQTTTTAKNKDLDAFNSKSAAEQQQMVNTLLYCFLKAINTPRNKTEMAGQYRVPVEGGFGGTITPQQITDAIKMALDGDKNGILDFSLK